MGRGRTSGRGAVGSGGGGRSVATAQATTHPYLESHRAKLASEMHDGWILGGGGPIWEDGVNITQFGTPSEYADYVIQEIGESMPAQHLDLLQQLGTKISTVGETPGSGGTYNAITNTIHVPSRYVSKAFSHEAGHALDFTSGEASTNIDRAFSRDLARLKSDAKGQQFLASGVNAYFTETGMWTTSEFSTYRDHRREMFAETYRQNLVSRHTVQLINAGKLYEATLKGYDANRWQANFPLTWKYVENIIAQLESGVKYPDTSFPL